MSKLKVFISHAKEDIDQARDLTYRLRHDGFDPWLDEHKLLPGQDWRTEIEIAIETADAVIIGLSKNSTNKRGYIQKEIKKAIDIAEEVPEETIFIIPVKFEECNVPRRLRLLHWVDLFRGDSYKKVKEALLDLAKKQNKIVLPEKPSTDLAGQYLASGNNKEGDRYEGRVTISETSNNTLLVVWNIGADRWESIGAIIGNTLKVQGDYNFVYQINEDGTLYGEWEKGLYEKLIPMPKGF